MSLTVSDHRAAARRALPRFLFDYLDGAAQTEQTMRRNEADLAALALRQRVLIDVADVQAIATLLGRAVGMPLALAPVWRGSERWRESVPRVARAQPARGRHRKCRSSIAP